MGIGGFFTTMDVTAKWLIDRIDNLRGEKNMSEYRLCELSGVTTSTMSAMRMIIPVRRSRHSGK